MSDIFIVSTGDLPVGLLELVRNYFSWHGMRTFFHSDPSLAKDSKHIACGLPRVTDTLIFVRSTESLSNAWSREEEIVRQFGNVIDADRKIVVAEAFNARDRPRYSNAALPQDGTHPLIAAGARTPDITFCSAEPTERGLRSLLSVALKSPIRLGGGLVDFMPTAMDWQTLSDGVLVAAGLEQQGSPNLRLPAWAGVRHDGAPDLHSLWEACGELPNIVSRTLARRAVIIGLLRNIARKRGAAVARPTDVRPLWPMLRSTLHMSTMPLRATLSSQGFYLIPLFSRVRDGRIEELVRLHIWPKIDAPGPATSESPERGVKSHHDELRSFSVHSHQPHATSWVLCGGLCNRTYHVREWPADSTEVESYNLFEVAWDGSNKYALGHNQSSLRNTQVPVSMEIDNSAIFRAGHSYVVPAGEFHETTAESPSIPTATLFYFDATAGWTAEARVVGPAAIDRSAPHEKNAIAGAPLVEEVSAIIGSD